MVDPTCVYVDRYGKLSLGRLKLMPAAGSAPETGPLVVVYSALGQDASALLIAIAARRGTIAPALSVVCLILGCCALRLLGGRSLAFFAKDIDCLLNVGAGLNKRGAAVRETCSRPFAQFFHEVSWYLHGLRLCTHPFLLLFHCFDEINSCEKRPAAKRPGAS